MPKNLPDARQDRDLGLFPVLAKKSPAKWGDGWLFLSPSRLIAAVLSDTGRHCNFEDNGDQWWISAESNILVATYLFWRSNSVRGKASKSSPISIQDLSMVKIAQIGSINLCLLQTILIAQRQKAIDWINPTFLHKFLNPSLKNKLFEMLYVKM
jgi:hypothetical protein